MSSGPATWTTERYGSFTPSCPHDKHESCDVPIPNGGPRRSCLQLGPDVPVLLLMWLIFALPVFFGILISQALGWLAFAYAVVVSSAILRISIAGERGPVWIGYSMVCILCSVCGLAAFLSINTTFPPSTFDDFMIVHHPVGARFACALCVISLLLMVLASQILPCFDIKIIGSSYLFLRDNAKNMVFGCDDAVLEQLFLSNTDVHVEKVAKDLLENRVFWSGEPVYDYAFYLANTHAWFGCLFCHPLHPYRKHERIIILLIHSALVVFPVAAFNQVVHNQWIRILVLAIIVTLPRNFLRDQLIGFTICPQKIAMASVHSRETFRSALIKHDEQEHGGNSPLTQLIRKARLMELVRRKYEHEHAGSIRFAFYAVCIICTIAICFLSCYLIHLHSPQPLGRTLFRYGDCLGFGFILELVFKLLIPVRRTGAMRFDGPLRFGGWALGFLGLWLDERRAVRERGAQATGEEGENSPKVFNIID